MTKLHLSKLTSHPKFYLLGLSWLAYITFTIIGFSSFNTAVMLPSILLCGVATWLYDYKLGLLTSLFSHIYNMLMMMFNLHDLFGWIPALEIGGLAAQLITIGFATTLKNNQKKTIELNSALNNRIQERTEELQDLTAYLIDQTESKRAQLSTNLYHEAKRPLDQLMRECDSLEVMMQSGHNPHITSASLLSEIAKKNIKLITNFTHHLSSNHIKEVGIKTAIQDLVDFYHDTTKTHFHIEITPRYGEIQTGATEHLYRITHEAVTNALRHGKATQVIIKLQIRKNIIQLTIINDGNTFPEQKSEGLGMHLINKRSQLIKATTQYSIDPNGLTKFECTAPFTSES